MKKQEDIDKGKQDVKKTSDSENCEKELTESEDENFTQEDFEDALRRVSRRF